VAAATYGIEEVENKFLNFTFKLAVVKADNPKINGMHSFTARHVSP
jgi:hypothetical protein